MGPVSAPAGLEAKARLGVDLYKKSGGSRGTNVKALYAIAWFRCYADETAERLPDQDFLVTPCRRQEAIYAEFAADMIAAGCQEGMCKCKWFWHVFRTAPELRHILISSLKRNFGRCSECVRLEAAVETALRSHDKEALGRAKQERTDHLGLARADRLHYYSMRQEARRPGADVMTLIIDKMDQAKNRVPAFTARVPKDVDSDILDSALDMHIVGVLVHGTPDDRFMYLAEQLPGDGMRWRIERPPRAPRAARADHARDVRSQPTSTWSASAAPLSRWPRARRFLASCTSRWTTRRTTRTGL